MIRIAQKHRTTQGFLAFVVKKNDFSKIFKNCKIDHEEAIEQNILAPSNW